VLCEINAMAARLTYQDTRRATCTNLIESTTGCKVRAFMTQNHISPDIATEIFILEPDDGDPLHRRGVNPQPTAPGPAVVVTSRWLSLLVYRADSNPVLCPPLLNGDTSVPIQFMVFDVLAADGQSLTSLSFARRREGWSSSASTGRHG
jgi:hypothetical protein